MNQFSLKEGCDELLPFPHIVEFASKKNTTIRFDSLKAFAAEPLRFYFIIVVMYGFWVYRRKSKEQHTASKEYFLAEGSLTWWAIGASLIASNISA